MPTDPANKSRTFPGGSMPATARQKTTKPRKPAARKKPVKPRKKAAKPKQTKLRIPGQFKPDRPIADGPFGPWAEAVLRQSDHITRQRLEATPDDLKLVSRLAYQRDKLGDDLAELLLSDRSVGRQFEQGLVQGIDSLDKPPAALVAFLEYYENIPDWAYLPELKEFLASSTRVGATAARYAMPDFALDGLAMATGFFVGANYPAVGQALVATGSVAAGTSRMQQTMNYVEDLVDIRGFLPFGKAIQSSAKVRLAHAFARRQIEKSGLWDKDYYGEIISEFDNMIFMSGLTLVPDLPAYARLSDRSKQAMKLQTKGMQYLLGAPRELVEMPIEENQRFFAMVVSHLDDSPHTARQVVKAFRENDYFRPTDTVQGQVSRELSFLTANMITRIGWGNAMADSIGLERRFMGLDLAAIADRINHPPDIVRILAPLASEIGKRIEDRARRVVQRSRVVRQVAKRLAPRALPAADEKLLYRGSYGAF